MLGAMHLRTTAQYVRELKPRLGAEVFAPARSRLLWLPVHLALIVTTIVAVASGWLPWMLVPVASLLLGVCYAGLTFLGHETMHGGTVRGRRLKHVVTFIGFLPFTLSPRLWRTWHNAQHHGNTNHPTIDPDKYPMLSVYEGSSVVRMVTDKFSLGGRRLSGVLSLMFGFTGQSNKILADAHNRGWMTKAQHRAAIAESAVGWALWATVAWLVGPLAFVFVFVLPMIVANVMVMSFILTNHGLSPMTDINDPLVNSLSVTVPKFYDFITLGFGFHTEHHMFPAISTRNAPAVRAAILELWPERYQAMPLSKALLALHRTARVYRDHETLIDPRTGATFPTLMPGPAAARQVAASSPPPAVIAVGAGDSTVKPASHAPRMQPTPI